MDVNSPYLFSVIGVAIQLYWRRLLFLVLCLPCCTPKESSLRSGDAGVREDVVWLRVGSVEVRESDLLHRLDEEFSGRRDAEARKRCLEGLGRSAQLVELALESDLLDDPVLRAELARVMAQRIKEQTLYPNLKDLGSKVSEKRSRELYEANLDRFQANEKRQVAVLWLDPGKDPQRQRQYQERLNAARTWCFENVELSTDATRGFGELSIDYSEHQATRFSGGVVGWLEQAGGMDSWSRTVADIVFSMAQPGDVSEVVTRPEGLFLVRYMANTPAFTRPFEAVSAELESLEMARLKGETEKAFWEGVASKHPIQVVNAEESGPSDEKALEE